MSLQALKDEAEQFAQKNAFGFANRESALKHWAKNVLKVDETLAEVNKSLMDLEDWLREKREEGSTRQQVYKQLEALKELKQLRDKLVLLKREFGVA